MPPLATIAILSIGDMGSGIARLLLAHNYHVTTNLQGRSEHTQRRADSLGIETIHSDAALVQGADYILSIVPPRDAIATATRVGTVWDGVKTRRAAQKKHPLYYVDLNAVSPATAREVGRQLPTEHSEGGESGGATLRFVDGGIIGGPPALQSPSSSSAPNDYTTAPSEQSWSKPSLVLSGAFSISDAPVSGANLSQLINVTHVGSEVGSATGLKMCFASLSKGFAALALQSYSTASQLGVLPELQRHLDSYAGKGVRERAERGMVGCAPKAYRWVAEMREIGRTFGVDGGFGARDGADGDRGGDVFQSIAETYRFVADETILGQERIGARKRGTTAEDTASVMAEALGKKRRRLDTDGEANKDGEAKA